MYAHEIPEQRRAASRIGGLFTWLGGGYSRELGERHERSTHAVAGAVVLLGAMLAWLVAALAVAGAVRSMPLWVIVALTLVFGLLVGAVTRSIAGDHGGGWLATAGRAAVAVAVGAVVGELAALAVFSGAIDRELGQRALRSAESVPAVAQASASLQQARDARSALDQTVEQARGQLDGALVIARCEYHPTPACPQTRITGVPGAGPETRTANELLADAQRGVDSAAAARDRQSPELEARSARAEQALADARHAAVADAGGGLDVRWVAMNDVTLAGAGALALRLLTIAFFVLLYLLPLILRTWRGETTHDRHTAARTERDRAELEAETAIAVKRAEVRREAEMMWAEHQLTQTRLAIEAQAEIDREHHRRRVVEALDGPVRAASQRTFDPATAPISQVPILAAVSTPTKDDDTYLPIAAEAEAASRAVPELPAGRAAEAPPEIPDNLPAPVESHAVEPEQHQPPAEHLPEEHRAAPFIPSIPDATKAAARWIRPLVPPFVARVIDTTTQPLRSARQVFEEVEEIAFSLKRTHKITVDSESSAGMRRSQQASPPEARDDSPQTNRIPSSRAQAGYGRHHDGTTHGEVASGAGHGALGQSPGDLAGLSVGSSDRDSRRELVEREGPRELSAPEGPRQLPPGK